MNRIAEIREKICEDDLMGLFSQVFSMDEFEKEYLLSHLNISKGEMERRISCTKLHERNQKMWEGKWTDDLLKELPKSLLHEFGCICAERALSFMKNPDRRSVKAIKVKRRWLKFEATDEELAKAREDSWTAASVAYDDAASVDAAAYAAYAASASAWTAAYAASAASAASASTVSAYAASADEEWEEKRKEERKNQYNVLQGLLRHWIEEGSMYPEFDKKKGIGVK